MAESWAEANDDEGVGINDENGNRRRSQTFLAPSLF